MAISDNPHHLILGKLVDYISGKTLTDTHDERYRQKIAKHLVESCRFKKKDIAARQELIVDAGSRKAMIKIDFLVRHQEKVVLIIKYAPGSLVTRRLSTLAMSRIIGSYQIPYAVITNGEDAEVLTGDDGKVAGQGLESIPDMDQIQSQWDSFSFKKITPKVFEQASRIAFACEIDGACPCDSDICTIDDESV